MKKFSKKILMLLMAIVVLVAPTFTVAVRQEVHNDRNYDWYEPLNSDVIVKHIMSHPCFTAFSNSIL